MLFRSVNTYPNAVFSQPAADAGLGQMPSIPARQLLVPLGAWFSLAPSQAFPLIAARSSEPLTIKIAFRPVAEWFTIRDVTDALNDYPVVAPNPNLPHMLMHQFLQSPPNAHLRYTDTRTAWNADIHLVGCFAFLADDERRWFTQSADRKSTRLNSSHT